MAHPVQLWVENEEIRLDAHGIWRSNGEPITHERTLEFFDRILTHTPDGWALVYGSEFKKVVVDATAYFADAFRGEGAELEVRVRGRGWMGASAESAKYLEIGNDPSVTLEIPELQGARVRLLQEAHAEFLVKYGERL